MADVIHDQTHDPIFDWDICELCNEALRLAFNRLAEVDLGPRDAGGLISRLMEFV